ncbi:MAG: hypothetical protein ABI142_12860 [Bryocella sp.]
MKTTTLLLFVIVTASITGIASAQAKGDSTVRAQWFTGSLESPSPALPKAGLVAVEPYVIYQRNTGQYDDKGGHQSVSDDIRQVDSVTLLKYGITDRLSIQALIAFAHVWNDDNSVTGATDLPAELDYRFNNENNKTGLPSVTASVGVSLPIGDYQRLGVPLDGLGTGSYAFKQGLLLQSLFDTPSHHPVRLRLYGVALEPLADVTLHDTTVYGTTKGFTGHAAPGFSCNVGLGASYALTQRWVFAFDLIQKLAHGSRVIGVDASGNAVNNQQSGSGRTAIAPAVEYNFSSHIGMIAGVAMSVAGRSTSSYFAPQIALSASF